MSSATASNDSRSVFTIAAGMSSTRRFSTMASIASSSAYIGASGTAPAAASFCFAAA
jgi:hypothetical protein